MEAQYVYNIVYMDHHEKLQVLTYSDEEEAYRIGMYINNLQNMDSNAHTPAWIRKTIVLPRHMDIEHATFIPANVKLFAVYNPKGFPCMNGDKWDYWFDEAVYHDQNLVEVTNKDPLYGYHYMERSNTGRLKFCLYMPVQYDTDEEAIIEIAKVAVNELFNRSIAKHGYTSMDDIIYASVDDLLERGFKFVTDTSYKKLVFPLGIYKWGDKK